MKKHNSYAEKVKKSAVRVRIDRLAFQWSHVLRFVEKGDLENAYANVLEMNDDLYLLRLMVKTGNCMEQLSSLMQRRISARVTALDDLEYLQKCVRDFGEYRVRDQIKSKPDKSLRQTGQSIFSQNTRKFGKRMDESGYIERNEKHVRFQRFLPEM